MPSDAKPIKTILQEMSPATMELPFRGLRYFPDVAKAWKNLGEEKRSRRVFLLWEFSYIERHD